MIALVVQHTVNESMGLLETVLTNKGWQVDIRCMEAIGTTLPGNLNGFDAMVIMGGPMGAYDGDKYPHLIAVQDLIRQAVYGHVPTIGICLGAQLIAQAMGGRVSRNPVKEIGWYPVFLTEFGVQSPLFQGLPTEFTLFQWHQDTFTLPENARWLVRGKTCLNQAFSINDCVWGLQFHPEVTPDIIGQWTQSWAGELQEFGGASEARIIAEKTAYYWREQQYMRDILLNNIELLLGQGRLLPLTLSQQ